MHAILCIFEKGKKMKVCQKPGKKELKFCLSNDSWVAEKKVELNDINNGFFLLQKKEERFIVFIVFGWWVSLSNWVPCFFFFTFPNV
jgi:hypothetical protein